MKHIIFIALAIFTFCFSIFGQANSTSCQKIIIDAPEQIGPEEKFKVSAALETGTSSSTDKFNWTIIKNEQLTKVVRTNFIELESGDIKDLSPIIVLADSFDAGCQNTAMVKIFITPRCGLPMTIDEYGKFPWADERARLDNVSIQMQHIDENQKLFIFYNFTKKTQAQVKNHLVKVLNFLTERGKLKKNRIVFLLSEEDYEKTKFQILPPNFESIACDDCILIRGENVEKLMNIFNPGK